MQKQILFSTATYALKYVSAPLEESGRLDHYSRIHSEYKIN